MNYYKPYSYLYKKESEPQKLKSCFVAKLPAGKNLSGPTILSVSGLTTISYSIVDDSGQTREWQMEGTNEFDWDGNPRDVKVIIGSGSGGGGGSIATSTSDCELF